MRFASGFNSFAESIPLLSTSKERNNASNPSSGRTDCTVGPLLGLALGYGFGLGLRVGFGFGFRVGFGFGFVFAFFAASFCAISRRSALAESSCLWSSGLRPFFFFFFFFFFGLPV